MIFLHPPNDFSHFNPDYAARKFAEEARDIKGAWILGYSNALSTQRIQ